MNWGEFKDLTAGANKKTIAKTIVKLWKHAHVYGAVKKVTNTILYY